MDRFEMMTSDSEQIVNGATDAEKALGWKAVTPIQGPHRSIVTDRR